MFKYIINIVISKGGFDLTLLTFIHIGIKLDNAKDHLGLSFNVGIWKLNSYYTIAWEYDL
jgi:hypothetical protein